MVGGTHPLPPQQYQQPLQTSTTTVTADEEALKRNTDCVYFLASPLTCKKGAECEYRHSDTARLNPRDCWFWLNGSCLNKKCAFRHPPLDGLLGTPTSTPMGSSLPSSQMVPVPVTSASYNSGKQTVPCIFFQQGFCLKSDRCPFFHAPSSTVIKKLVPPRPAAINTSEPPSLKKPFSGLEKCSQEKSPHTNVPKSRDLISNGTPQAKVEEAARTKNGISFIRYSAQPPLLDDGPPRYGRPTDIPPDTNGDSMSRSHHVQQLLALDDHVVLNSREAGEFSREPSPGFDVLVDDELGKSDYYHNEDHHYGRSGSHHDYGIDRSADYDPSVDYNEDTYRDLRQYDSYDQMEEPYGREKRRASSERMVRVGSAHVERSQYPSVDCPDRIADLRHHLSKQRKVNGLRSVISHDYVRDNHVEDWSHGGSSRRHQHHLVTPNESSVVSSRLRGRIKLPRRSSSPVNGSDLPLERKMDKGRNLGRRVSSIHHGRLGDRINGRGVQEEITNDGISFKGLCTRETVNENNTNFAGPKSLADLKKGGKIAENEEQQMNNNDRLSLAFGKRKYPILENPPESESGVLFEGPKPLSEILKKKKVSKTIPENVLISGNRDYNNPKEEEKSLTINTEENQPVNASEVETKDGMILGEPVEDHKPEIFHHRDGEFDYDHIDGVDDILDEAENAEGEEYFDDEDDFAKKIGVMFS